jgi:hypothetical protein
MRPVNATTRPPRGILVFPNIEISLKQIGCALRAVTQMSVEYFPAGFSSSSFKIVPQIPSNAVNIGLRQEVAVQFACSEQAGERAGDRIE